MRFFPRWLRSAAPQRLVFVLVMEAGRLELQGRRLIASIRKFGGRWSQSPIHVYQPRAGAELAPETQVFLQKHGCFLTALDLNQTWADWGLFNKAYACAHLESLLDQGTDFLVFLDSDQLMLKEPAGLCLAEGHELGVKPVDVMNIGSPVAEPLDAYWRRIYEVAGVPFHLTVRVFPSVEDVPIRPYFNAGVIVSRPPLRLFHAWVENAEKMAAHKTWWQGLPRFQHYHIAQAVLSATILARLPWEKIELLDLGLNYPLNVQHLLSEKKRFTHLDQITLLHYKGAFETGEWTQRMKFSSSQRRWLQDQQIPLG